MWYQIEAMDGVLPDPGGCPVPCSAEDYENYVRVGNWHIITTFMQTSQPPPGLRAFYNGAYRCATEGGRWHSYSGELRFDAPGVPLGCGSGTNYLAGNRFTITQFYCDPNSTDCGCYECGTFSGGTYTTTSPWIDDPSCVPVDLSQCAAPHDLPLP